MIWPQAQDSREVCRELTSCRRGINCPLTSLHVTSTCLHVTCDLHLVAIFPPLSFIISGFSVIWPQAQDSREVCRELTSCRRGINCPLTSLHVTSTCLHVTCDLHLVAISPPLGFIISGFSVIWPQAQDSREVCRELTSCRRGINCPLTSLHVKYTYIS